MDQLASFFSEYKEVLNTSIAGLTAIFVIYLNYYVYQIKKELVEKSAADVTELIRTLDQKVSGYWKFFSRWKVIRKSVSLVRSTMPEDENDDLYATLFDFRKDHYKEEKNTLCEQFLHHILVEDKELQKYDKIYLMIDSGSTVFPIFKKLCEYYKSENYSKILKKVEIITNNIPGQNELMKHGRKGDDYKADMFFVCHTIPGVVEGKYSATLGLNSIAYIHNFVSAVRARKRKTKFISVLTGNYISTDDGILTRGNWHGMLKNALIHNSDMIFIISPLGKIFNYHSAVINKMIADSPICFPPDKKYRPLTELSEEEQKLLNNIEDFCGLSEQDISYICYLIELSRKFDDNNLVPQGLLDKDQIIYLITTERDLEHGYPNNFYKYFLNVTNVLDSQFPKERILKRLFLPQLHSHEFMIKLEAFRETDLYFEYEFPHKEIREPMKSILSKQ